MKKIRFIVYNAYGIGGTVKTIFNFADYFHSVAKYDVEILSIRRNRENPILPINKKITIVALYDVRRLKNYSDAEKSMLEQPSKEINPEEDLYSMFNEYIDGKLVAYLKSLKGGIIVATMPSLNSLLTKYVDGTVLKIGQEHKSYADHSIGIQKMIKNNYGGLDAITILTEKNKHIYNRKIKNAPPIFVLGNGTEGSCFKSILKQRTIIAAGRYVEQKGYDMLIEAFALIADDNPEWILKIYGEGELAEEYIKLIQANHLERRIILEPGCDNMNEKYSEASINICSSYYEPFGMTLIEGFAMGLPCVSFSCDGPCEIISDGFDGILVEKEDIFGLAKAIEKLMRDEKLRFQMGKNALKTWEKYDIKKIGYEFQRIVETTKRRNIHLTDDKSGYSENEQVDNGKLLFDYQDALELAESGRIGFKALLTMIKKWFEYKCHIN